MKRFIDILVIAGFLAVDFLFFHDAFKPGEHITVAQWLTGLLSVPVFVMSAQSLTRNRHA